VALKSKIPSKQQPVGSLLGGILRVCGLVSVRILLQTVVERLQQPGGSVEFLMSVCRMTQPCQHLGARVMYAGAVGSPAPVFCSLPASSCSK
jgi:hypothetical protein